MRWLRDPYRPLGTSYWGYRARYAVLVHLALIAPVVGGLAWTLRLALPGAWDWLSGTPQGWIALGLYVLAGLAFRIQPFDPERVSVPFSQDRDLANLQILFLPGYFVLDGVLGAALLLRYAGHTPAPDPWRVRDDARAPERDDRERPPRMRG